MQDVPAKLRCQSAMKQKAPSFGYLVLDSIRTDVLVELVAHRLRALGLSMSHDISNEISAAGKVCVCFSAHEKHYNKMYGKIWKCHVQANCVTARPLGDGMQSGVPASLQELLAAARISMKRNYDYGIVISCKPRTVPFHESGSGSESLDLGSFADETATDPLCVCQTTGLVLTWCGCDSDLKRFFTLRLSPEEMAAPDDAEEDSEDEDEDDLGDPEGWCDGDGEGENGLADSLEEELGDLIQEAQEEEMLACVLASLLGIASVHNNNNHIAKLCGATSRFKLDLEFIHLVMRQHLSHWGGV